MESVIQDLFALIHISQPLASKDETYVADLLSAVMEKHYKSREIVPQKDIAKEQIDAVVDIVYYSCDKLSQFGHKWGDGSTVNYVEQVKEFTEGARQIICPPAGSNLQIPENEMKFLVIAILSELIEGIQAESRSLVESEKAVAKFRQTVFQLWWNYDSKSTYDTVSLHLYRIYNTIMSGLDFNELDFYKAFNIVHQANMNKGVYNHEIGKVEFSYKEIGGVKKIIKPEGWKEPSYGELMTEKYRKNFFTLD